MNRLFVTLAPLSLALAVPLAPASAQPVQITVGTQVTDSSGGSVGTITSIRGDNLVVKTDKHEVALPRSSFTPNAGKLLFGMTQAQLNAEVEKSLAAGEAAVKAGARVMGAQGAAIGTIDGVDADTVTITLESGKKVQLNRASVRGNSDGTVTTGFTVEQLQAEIDKAAAGSQGQ